MVATGEREAASRRGEVVRLALGAPAALAFGAVALARRARALHPVGAAFAATLVLDGPAAHRVPELGTPGAARAGVVRFSRGGGFPEGWPDVHGVALSLASRGDGAGGAAGRQDLLWSSAGRSTLGRRLLQAPRALDDVWATSLTSFAAGGRRVVWGAHVQVPEVERGGEGPGEAPAGGPLTIEALRARPERAPAVTVHVATGSGLWEHVGTITPGTPVAPEDEGALAFDPWHDADGITPVGALNAVRDAAYRASRRARRARGG